MRKLLHFAVAFQNPLACQDHVVQAKGPLYTYPPLQIFHLALYKVAKEEADVVAILT